VSQTHTTKFQRFRIGIAIGTPTRLIDLLNEGLLLLRTLRGLLVVAVCIFIQFVLILCVAGVLSLEKLQRLVVDCSHIDQKKRGILDMRELQIPLMELLNRQGLKERYTAPEDKVDLMFY
jgi:U3-containing 90S pre-ribosomal complex subunit